MSEIMSRDEILNRLMFLEPVRPDKVQILADHDAALRASLAAMTSERDRWEKAATDGGVWVRQSDLKACEEKLKVERAINADLCGQADLLESGLAATATERNATVTENRTLRKMVVAAQEQRDAAVSALADARRIAVEEATNFRHYRASRMVYGKDPAVILDAIVAALRTAAARDEEGK
jgi:glutamate-1-semialdehyde aminotransferase